MIWLVIAALVFAFFSLLVGTWLALHHDPTGVMLTALGPGFLAGVIAGAIIGGRAGVSGP